MPRILTHLRIALFLTWGATLVAQDANEADREFFEAQIRPLLVTHCYECHSATSDEPAGGLLLDARDHLRRGGDSGPVIEPGNPDGSLLLQAVRYEALEMPPSGKLPDRAIDDIQRWIRRGAYDPRDDTARPPAPAASVDIEQGREFWSFQPPRSHPVPRVEHQGWPRRTMDAFVLERMEEAGLPPNPPADRRTLVRRVTFDLTGLPPTPGQVARFIGDQRPDAYERLVQRLLASARFGERWARLWLDVARYAEDQAHIVGNNQSLFYPNAYLYRDWVVHALNADLPFDQFAKLQLAADLFEPDDPAQYVALGFLGLGPKYYRRKAPEVMADEWEDRVDTVTRGFLGLTVACARCHDHKYDPIPTEDYYALAGVFAGTEMFNRPLNPSSEGEREGKARDADRDDEDDDAKKTVETMHIVREGKPQDLHVHIRGDVTNPGDLVPRRFPQVVFQQPVPLGEGSGRRQLAEAIATAENPLTARVIVNRIWAQYFGRPLVSTPSNFGALGARPTHPELLDDLAVRFMQAGWSLKWLHREIVLSATYQQASHVTREALELDPSNALLSRMSRRRLSVEMWRDALLSVTGELDGQIGGESLDVQDASARRRTVYSRVSRLELTPLLALFDFPDPNVHAAARSETITPLQKLFVLNSDFMVRRAERLVGRLGIPARDEADVEVIERAYRLLFSRAPTAEEAALAVRFVGGDEPSTDRWQRYAQILLASNELLYLD